MASKKTPYGYILAEGKIAVDVEEADIIRRIFDERANGLSGSKIGAALFDEQIPYFSEDKKKAILLYRMRYEHGSLLRQIRLQTLAVYQERLCQLSAENTR